MQGSSMAASELEVEVFCLQRYLVDSVLRTETVTRTMASIAESCCKKILRPYQSLVLAWLAPYSRGFRVLAEPATLGD